MSVNLTAFKNKKPAAAKNDKPFLPCDEEGVVKQLAQQVIDEDAKEKAAKGSKEQAQGQIKIQAREFIFRINHNKPSHQLTILVEGETGLVQVSLKEAYTKVENIDPIAELIGQDLAAMFFRQYFEIKIKSDAIPSDRQQEVIDNLAMVMDQIGLTEAVEVSASIKPTPEFASLRHSKLTPDQNLELEEMFGGLTVMAVAPARGQKR